MFKVWRWHAGSRWLIAGVLGAALVLTVTGAALAHGDEVHEDEEPAPTKPPVTAPRSGGAATPGMPGMPGMPATPVSPAAPATPLAPMTPAPATPAAPAQQVAPAAPAVPAGSATPSAPTESTPPVAPPSPQPASPSPATPAAPITPLPATAAAGDHATGGMTGAPAPAAPAPMAPLAATSVSITLRQGEGNTAQARAVIVDGNDRPVRGLKVGIYRRTAFGEVELTRAASDHSGAVTASLPAYPAQALQVRARYPGSKVWQAADATAALTIPPVPAVRPAGSLTTMYPNPWFVWALLAVVGGVWLTYAWVLFSLTRLGRAAIGEREPGLVAEAAD